MPAVLFMRGWRLFFYMNERNEPPHVHAEKGDIACKFWLREEEHGIEEAYVYNLSSSNRRQLRRIIYEHFNYLLAEYKGVHGNG